jgi:hypothetical protein
LSATTRGDARDAVQARVWLRAGADLLPAPLTTADVARWAAERARDETTTPIDGALGLTVAGVSIIDDGVWDHLDGLLAAWQAGLQALRAGGARAEALVQLPDTRLEVELQRAGDQVTVWCEGREATTTLVALASAMAAARLTLLEACAALPEAQRPDTAALDALAAAADRGGAAAAESTEAAGATEATAAPGLPTAAPPDQREPP